MTDAIEAELASAAAALESFARGPAQQAADDVGASFERAGARIANALGSAATGGEAAFKRMAKVILEELAKIALQRLLTQGAPQADASSFASSSPVAVHFHLAGGDANAVARHQGQIAAAIARAVAYGRRNL